MKGFRDPVDVRDQGRSLPSVWVAESQRDPGFGVLREGPELEPLEARPYGEDHPHITRLRRDPHRRQQDVAVLLSGHAARCSKADRPIRHSFQRLDHDAMLLGPVGLPPLVARQSLPSAAPRATRAWIRNDCSMEVARSIEIFRPIDEVFALVADARNDPKWCPKVISAVQLVGNGPGRGARYEVVHRPLPMRPPSKMTVE